MEDNLTDLALRNPHTAAHMALFRDQWLPAALGVDNASTYTNVIDSYLITLHPGIYRYGPLHPMLLTHIANLRTHLEAPNPVKFITDLHTAAKVFLTFIEENYLAYADNPAYAYRNYSTFNEDLDIPNYETCITTLDRWLRINPTTPAITDYNATDIIDAYKEALLGWDLFKTDPTLDSAALKAFARHYNLGAPKVAAPR